MAACSRHWLTAIVLIGALLLGYPASVSGADRFGADRTGPRVAHFISDDTGIGFVLDRSGELAKLKFDNSEEIFVLRWQPAAGGDRLLVRDDGEVLLRLSGLGGVTLFTDENRRGIPVSIDRLAPPLVPPSPSIATVRDVAGQIMIRLRTEVGREIVFEADWGRAANDGGARLILFDAIRNAGTALNDLARNAMGRSALTRNLVRVRFMQGRGPDIYLNGNMLVIVFSVEQGLAGRPSSRAIRRQLMQLMR